MTEQERKFPMAEQATCQLCGDPMPPGEEMFNFHGYSGPCPKPPLPPKPEKAIDQFICGMQSLLVGYGGEEWCDHVRQAIDCLEASKSKLALGGLTEPGK